VAQKHCLPCQRGIKPQNRKKVKVKVIASTCLIGVTVFGGYGCATPAQSVNMIPPNLSLTKKFSHTVSTTVAGGKTTNPLGTSQIASADFQQALESSILNNQMFSGVVSIDKSDYNLDVRLLKCAQPFIGADFKVTLTTEWKLTKCSIAQPVWHKTVVSEYTAKFSNAVMAIKRLRLANEGAARENIKQGLSLLAKAKI